MARKPSFQFYPADWLSDGAVQAASLNTQGAWINLLCYMWNAPEQGKLTGSEDEIRRLSGAKIEEWPGVFEEIKALKIGEVTIRNKKVTLINRRMNKAFKIKEQGRLRKRKYDEERKSNAEVTSYSSSSSSINELPNGNSLPLSPEKSQAELLVSQFNELCLSAPKVIKLEGNRLKKTLKILKEYPDLEEWSKYFQEIEKSDFLTGRAPGKNGPFIANFDWIIKPDNLLKIIEGNYKNRNGDRAILDDNGTKPKHTSRAGTNAEHLAHEAKFGKDNWGN